jgi:hypothetical protein
MHVEEMIATHPDAKGQVNRALLHCIEQCYSCAQTCISCADACLAEPIVVELRLCIRLNLDCADLCTAAGRIATRRTASNETLIVETLNACALACRICADECERHAGPMEHCRICADACNDCEEACSAAIRWIRSLH